MPLSLHWIGEDEIDQVVQVRLGAYAAGRNDAETFAKLLREDVRAKVGDYLLARRDGEPVGTATSLSLRMWARGAAHPAQGVAWVGTIRTARRSGATQQPSPPGDAMQSSPPAGIASAVMRCMIDRAREREQVVSALMPFRPSFYARFGYGLVERQCEWTVPLCLLPAAGCDGIRFFEDGDLPAMEACRQRMVERGQCDFESPHSTWGPDIEHWNSGFIYVDPSPAGGVRGWAVLHHQGDSPPALKVTELYYDSLDSLRRLLGFIASLQDQYREATFTLPADLPINRLLKEAQICHRPVSHVTPSCRPITRMQLRILDHTRFLESLHLPDDRRGRVVVAIAEPEGSVSRLGIDISGGRASVGAAKRDADVECDAPTWAAIATGELGIDAAGRFGLVHISDPACAGVLRALADGPLPFSTEYF